MSGYAALGPTMEMATGMSAMMGYRNGQPENTGPSYLDPIGGFNAAAAILTALHYRRRTGKGNVLKSAAGGGGDAAHRRRSCCLRPRPASIRRPMAITSSIWLRMMRFRLPARTRWVVIAAEDETQWRALCRVMERPDLAEDSRFATLAARHANEDLLTADYRGLDAWPQ